MDRNLYMVATAIVLLWILVVACFAEPVRWIKRPSIRVRKRQALGNRNTMCADPGTPDNGFRIGAVFYRGYSVRFGCNPGYQLAGARILNCTTDSTRGVQWDAMTPQCTPQRAAQTSDPCGAPPLASRFAFQSSYTPGASVEYQCVSGYVQQSGDVQLTCNGTQWQGELLQCRRLGQCQDHRTINHGFRILNGTTEGSTVVFGCNEEFDLLGNQRLTCGSNGLWTGSWPTCVKTSAECGDPGTPFLGSRQVLGTTEGSVVTYSCNSGFRLVGDSQRTCLATGEWSGSLPLCNRVSCPQLSSPTGGSIQFSGSVTPPSFLYVGLVASYSCNSGYVLSGASSSTCSENGTWTNNPPRCNYVVCGSLRHPRNGRVRVREKSFGATANYSCLLGYGLMGNPTRICQSSGIWSGSMPTCVGGTCGSLQDPVNGRVTYTSMTIRSAAHYYCNIGYIISGSSRRICRGSRWSGREPTCEPVMCPMLIPPFNGAITMTNENLVFSEATYTCNTGYALIGLSTRQCRPSRIWSSKPPGCYEIRCGVLQNPINGTVIFQDDRNGSEAMYECVQGHVLRFGDRIRTCMENSLWSGDVPCCILVDCGVLMDPDNGRVDFSSGTTFGSTATYKCTPPFAVNGTETRVCEANGTWSGEEPLCTEYFCPSLEQPINGTLRLSDGTSLNSQATYNCFRGNVLMGDSTRTCTRDGWSGQDPTCTFVECPELTAPINGTVGLPTLMAFGFVANYSCINRNTLIGQDQRECMANGQWSGNEPMCQLIECPILQNPTNGRVIFNDYIPGELTSYECDRGFGLRGNARRQCTQTGMWTGSDPTCEMAFCPQLDSPTNGRVLVTGLGVQEQAIYVCDQGFVIVGLLVRICLDNGEWGGDDPTCTRAVCPNLPNPENGQVVQIINGNIPGTVASYSCDSGYTLVGNMSRVCVQVNREEEVWTGETPTCQRIVCPALPNPVNGEVRTTSILPGGVAIYLCNTGFTVDGSLTRVCGNDGLWSTDDPTCSPNNGTVTCPILLQSSLQNGMIELSTTTVGSTASYSCFLGYQLDRPPTRQCQSDGTWTGNDPVCNPVNCGPLDDPVNGVVMIDMGTTLGMAARYFCNAGYLIAGAFEVRVCTISGQWSGEAPRCEPIDCGSLPNPLNGMVDLSEGTVLGSQATYTCIAGYQLEGNSTRLCTIAGEWRPEAPTCALSVGTVDCGDPGTPNNGLRVLSSTTSGSTVEYSCVEGYMLQGNSSRTCQANGVWSGEVPSCIAVMCPLLMRPENGIIFVTGQTVGSRATYFCNNGFTRMGLLQRVCMGSGAWGGQEPVCISDLEIDCPSLESPARGEVTFTTLTVGSTTNYTCQSGYMVNGVTTRVCQPGGVWSEEEPMCDRVICMDPGVPLNGRRVGRNFTSGSRVYFVCMDGYDTVGAKVILCQDNGIWDSATPTCSPANNTCNEEGNMVLDQFGRLCNCTNSQLASCCRYRQDWTSLSMEEKQRYINAVKTIANNSQFQQLYNQLVGIYRTSFDTIAQSTVSAISQFFPWQRYFLLEYEDLLRLTDTRITIPYWDWTLLPNDPYSSPVFDPQNGFGNSSDDATMCVNSGPFREGEFEVTASAGGGCLRRLYSNLMYPSRQIVSNLLSLQANRFNEFHNSLQLFIQLNIRCFVGGQMCSMDAANDPLYPLHLTRVDIVLDEWQNSSPDRAAARYANENTPLVLSFDNSLVVSNFSNDRDLPYGTCIQYAELQASSQSSRAGSARNIPQSGRPSSQRINCISEAQMEQLRMSEWEKIFMRRKCG